MSAPFTSRRGFIAGAAATSGLLFAGCNDGSASEESGDQSGAPASAVDGPPNILYITADDLGTRLGAYGDAAAITPRIDAFAAESVLFERCYCQIAICGASRTSILTGLRPETTGVVGNDDQWREAVPDAVSLPRQFRDAGYRTFASGKINDPRNGDLDDAWDDQDERSGVDSAEPALALLDRVAEGDSGEPFFAALGFDQPHCPWTPTPEAAAAHPPDSAERSIGPGRETRAGWINRCLPDARDDDDADLTAITELTEDEARAAVSGYAASITDLDAMVGAVLDRAGELGLLENTIVIFWSGDHGFSLGDGGAWGKWTNYDSATRIPLIMQVPGTPAARVEGMVEAVDMYPTLLELTGVGLPAQQLDGVSFAPLLAEPEQPWRSAVFTRYGWSRSVKDERYNLIVDDWSGTTSLFDRVDDPQELSDIAAEQPEVVARLRAVLDAGPGSADPR